ncbi:YaiO family outer membrane beta-barrel protein [Algoriphagus sp. D3-2-R+10]|uniref:YaiO family outer membrane beta-barrel protein n=1 Tax=Algoriphagus aurantiacus TaxID=3103948 RepID=UPI002B3C15AA|nr:YaiO family outer membrane beta-barrel protein [Algoriphagus sp. D3-2-R+10]MEB2775264.1 YaiO family outer membrane beta-barrel protein [Algoriphagus sp. D3-2-R+10]
MKKIFILLICSVIFTIVVNAQDSFDPDALLVDARTLILDGKYIEGRKIAFRALSKYPDYADILILVGRSYAWEGKNDSASIYLERAIIAAPDYVDGYAAYLDNLSWADQYENADKVLAKARQNLGETLPNLLRYKESRLLYYKEDYNAAYDIAEDLFEKKYKNEELLDYMQTLQRYRRNNAVGVTYDYDSFEGDLSPWNTFSFYARTRTKLTGTLIGRVTQSSRFDANGTLFELDAYPSLGKKAYAYLNVGGSSASFFPEFRFGASIYFNLPKAWEIDGGFRYLQFSEITNIYTASVGKYVGNWWLNLRGNVIPGTGNSLGTSANLQARYYFKTGEDFFSIQLSSGVSPDEESRDPTQLLNSYRARVGYQQLLTERFMVYAFSGYSRDELGPDRFRNNLNFSLGVEYRF